MKNFILLLTAALFIVSCDQNEGAFDLTPQQLVGKRYSISYSSIKFISTNMLEWNIQRLSHKPHVTTYRLEYQLDGNRIRLASKDNVHIDHSSGYDVVYFNDGFVGSFVSNSTIRGEISSAYASYASNTFLNGSGESTADVSFKLK